jgi:Spy/CpxP family protein refolding chaperone
MCHASGRARRHHGLFDPLQFSHRPEHHEPHEHHAHHHRGEMRGCFMPHHDHHHEWDRSEGRSGLGVRRPLRFLAHKLDLNEAQITELARILNDLKTERAQAEVDDRRSLADFADAVAGEAFDTAKAAGAGERRVQSASRVRETLVHALDQIHALLNPEQRQRLAYLIRTGVLAL